MTVENRRAVEALSTVFEQVAERARANRWPADLVADVALRTGLSLAIAQRGIRGVAEQCRRLGEELGQFADAIEAAE